MDLRCENKLHGELLPEENIIEVKCASRFCGAGDGSIVLHRFDTRSGKLIETRHYRNPQRRV